jgi:branched-chain amino acid transport system permease protein
LAVTSPQFWISVITLAGIYAAVTMVLNVEAGWGGMWDLGVIGLMAVGAYTYGIVTANDPSLDTRFQPGWPIWAGILASMTVGGVVALLIGLPALRLRREYFLITTFAFAEVIRQLAIIQGDITNGTIGFNRLARPFENYVSGTDYNYVLLAIVAGVVALVFLLTHAISRSAYGRALRSMRDNEPVALSVGVGVTQLRLQTFVMAGVIFGAIAPVYLWWTRSLVPQLFIPAFTFTAWTALVIGGMGSRLGPLVGALVLIGFTEAVRLIDVPPDQLKLLVAIQPLAIGLLLILVLRFRPEGLFSERNAFGAGARTEG